MATGNLKLALWKGGDRTGGLEEGAEDWLRRGLDAPEPGSRGGGVDFQAGNYWGTVDLEEGGDWTQMRTETMPLPSAADYIRSQ